MFTLPVHQPRCHHLRPHVRSRLQLQADREEVVVVVGVVWCRLDTVLYQHGEDNGRGWNDSIGKGEERRIYHMIIHKKQCIVVIYNMKI